MSWLQDHQVSSPKLTVYWIKFGVGSFLENTEPCVFHLSPEESVEWDIRSQFIGLAKFLASSIAVYKFGIID